MSLAISVWKLKFLYCKHVKKQWAHLITGFWFLNTTLLLKEPEILAKIADSRTRVEKLQDNAEIILSLNVRKWAKNDGGMAKGPRANLKELLLASQLEYQNDYNKRLYSIKQDSTIHTVANKGIHNQKEEKLLISNTLIEYGNSSNWNHHTLIIFTIKFFLLYYN